MKKPGYTMEVTGFVMAEQVKSIDFNARVVERIENAPQETLDEVLFLLDACIY
jgi:mRNA-degrading endonuclease toxin of MazEF toxin-antitoxin module